MTNTIKEYDNNGNLIHFRNSDGYEFWREYDTNGNEIHSRDSDGYEDWREYDTNGKCIHYRDSNGYEWWREYDEHGKEIHSRDSDGYEVWCEYDDNGKLINTRNTSGATGHHHAAAEEKVRGELAVKAFQLSQRAERAEAERDALDKQVGELIKRVDEARSLYLAEKSKNADAKREGAYEALTMLAEWWSEVESHTAHSFTVAKNVRSFRDRDYAPTPARSVTMSGWVVTYDAKRDYAWHAKAPGRATHQHTLAELIASMGVPKAPDTEYTALCALAEAK
jgi:YD repeat-containing protein